MDWLNHFFNGNIDWKQVLLIGATPIFIIAFFIEKHLETRRGNAKNFSWRETFANLSLGGAYQVAEVVMAMLVTGAI